MQWIRSQENPNTVAGILMLILLMVFAGPSTLYGLVGRVFPGATIDTPCEWLRESANRGQRQSLIGRGATSPIALEVISSPVPNTPGGTLVVSVIVINRSIGTVPFLFNPATVRIGDDGTSGVGIIFDGFGGLNSPPLRQDSATFPASDVRTLGPHQRCVVSFTFTFEQLSAVGFGGNINVRAFYRINSIGVVPQGTNVFGDQGFHQMQVTSEPELIPLASQ